MPVMAGGEGESRHNASLRPVVADIDRAMSHLADGTLLETSAAVGALLDRWADLVELLALGPPPETRACPVCHGRGMRSATRCGFCWTKLSPLAQVREGQFAAPSFDGG